jgi:hypothetical protein
MDCVRIPLKRSELVFPLERGTVDCHVVVLRIFLIRRDLGIVNVRRRWLKRSRYQLQPVFFKSGMLFEKMRAGIDQLYGG